MSKKTSTQLCICGMHCRSCELLVEDELAQVSGVESIKIDYRTGRASVIHTGSVSLNLLEKAVQKAGYSLGSQQSKPVWISRSVRTWGQLGLVGAVLILLYLILNRSGLTLPSFNYASDQTITWTALLVGLTAGVSTCMALVGGLVAGIMGKYQAAYPDAGWQAKLKPLVFFLLGRLLGFALFGGLLGSLGSVLTLSLTSTALLTLIVAVVMLFLGIQLLGVFPRVSQMSLTLPVGLARKLH